MILLSSKVKTDIKGQRFFNYKVIKPTYNTNARGEVLWLCKCDCGNEFLCEHSKIVGKYLKKSCGKCNFRKTLSKNTFKELESHIEVFDNKGNKTLIDKNLKDEILKVYWFVEPNGYVKSVTGRKHKTALTLHKFVLDCNKVKVPKGFDIDHINGNKSDNRFCNLRVASRSQNNINRNNISKNSTSGFTGVSYRKAKDDYRAYITYKGKQISLGIYKNKEEAIKARKEAEVKYYGEFSPKGVINK